jgi:hypothetical protein
VNRITSSDSGDKMAETFDTNEFKKPTAADVTRKADLIDFAAKVRDADPISGNASLAHIKEALHHRLPSVDYAQIFSPDKRVVFFGERHDDLTQKDEIISRLGQLKQKEGLTHVALEMLNDADRPYVKEYFAGTGSRQIVLDRLKARWSAYPGAPEKYMEVIDAVKAARLQPIALDESGSFSDDHTDSPFRNRNERWATRLSDVLKSDKVATILVYSGRDHVGYGGSGDHANEILKSEFGYSSNVVLFSSAIDDSSNLAGRVSIAAAGMGLKRTAFALSINASEVERPGDFVLHQPQ